MRHPLSSHFTGPKILFYCIFWGIKIPIFALGWCVTCRKVMCVHYLTFLQVPSAVQREVGPFECSRVFSLDFQGLGSHIIRRRISDIAADVQNHFEMDQAEV